MHICFIEDTFHHGGTQIWVVEAIRYCLTQGVEVTLLAPENSWIIEQEQGTNTHIAPYSWEDVIQLRAKQKAIWAEALMNCNVALCTVHPPRKGFHCVIFAAQCIQENRLQTYLIPKTGTIVPEYKREYYQAKGNLRSSVIAISKFTQSYLIYRYKIPADKVELIYQGVDVRRFQPSQEKQSQAQKRYPLPPQAKFVLGCIGSFEERKGQIVLLEALSQLAHGALPEIHLMLVGDGPDEGKLRELVRSMNLEKYVSFFHFTSQPEYVFQRADVLVLPSIAKEGLPNVLLESMAMATPVIASDLGGIAELIVDEETGLLVEAGNSEHLEETILRLRRNPALGQKMIRKSSQLMHSNFDKERQFAHFLDFFNKASILV